MKYSVRIEMGSEIVLEDVQLLAKSWSGEGVKRLLFFIQKLFVDI
ncbi:hypothetical protein [Bacillus swezeyi]|nr:hypothetical protein [Bacillus swezeyi]